MDTKAFYATSFRAKYNSVMPDIASQDSFEEEPQSVSSRTLLSPMDANAFYVLSQAVSRPQQASQLSMTQRVLRLCHRYAEMGETRASIGLRDLGTYIASDDELETIRRETITELRDLKFAAYSVTNPGFISVTWRHF